MKGKRARGKMMNYISDVLSLRCWKRIHEDISSRALEIREKNMRKRHSRQRNLEALHIKGWVTKAT